MTFPNTQSEYPDFYIVGQPKAGTTALYEILRHHPDIFLPEVKEPQYFAREIDCVPHFPWMPKSQDDYLALFARAAPTDIVGEASALYLWSRTAATEIAHARPDARIVILFREPASFLSSWHLMLLRSRIECEPDLRTALALEPLRRHGEHLPPNGYWPELLFYSDHMTYVDQLQRFTSLFPPHQVLVLTYDEFRRDNAAAVGKILRFLDVDDTVALPLAEANTSYRVRLPWAQRMIDLIGEGRGSALKKAIMPITTQRLRRQALDYLRDTVVHASPRPPEPSLMLELRRQYMSEVTRLGECLGRDLVKEWGYDRV